MFNQGVEQWIFHFYVVANEVADIAAWKLHLGRDFFSSFYFHGDRPRVYDGIIYLANKL